MKVRKTQVLKITMQENGKALIINGDTFPLAWFDGNIEAAEEAAVFSALPTHECVYHVIRSKAPWDQCDEPQIDMDDGSKLRKLVVRLHGHIAKAWLRNKTPELYLEALALLMGELDNVKRL